jgi:hypothetical protein
MVIDISYVLGQTMTYLEIQTIHLDLDSCAAKNKSKGLPAAQNSVASGCYQHGLSSVAVMSSSLSTTNGTWEINYYEIYYRPTLPSHPNFFLIVSFWL